VEHEDPHGEARGNEDAEGGGAGITCGRARQAETVAERLRREGTHVHEDTRFDVRTGRPLADLRHVLGECPGLPDRARRVEELVMALDGVVGAVPQRPDTSAFLKLTRAARVALEWSDQVVLTEERWRQVDAVLAAFVPDLARKESTPPRGRAEAGAGAASWAPTMHTTMQPRKPTKKEEEEEGKATAEARRWQGR